MATPTHELFLVTIAGKDSPGVTAAVTRVLAEYNARLLDIGQAVIHEQLSLGMLVQVPQGPTSGVLIKDLLLRGNELGVRVKFSPVAEERYEDWVAQQGKARYIVTVLGRGLPAVHLSRVAEVIAGQGLNIDRINRLSGRVALDEYESSRYTCVELSVRGDMVDRLALQGGFLDFAHETGIDVAVQADDVYRRNRRLVAFDMDSTLIQMEVIDELAKAAGAGEHVSRITQRAMHGEIDFETSLRQRVACLKGLDAEAMERIASALPLSEGVERLFAALSGLGLKTALLSGGFTYFGHRLQERLGIDHVHANHLVIRDGKLTGELEGPIVDAHAKAQLLAAIATKEAVSLKQTVAVGDGANDLPMLASAGLGIAFRAKPIVQREAENSLSTAGLDGILYLIGFRDRETVEALEVAQ